MSWCDTKGIDKLSYLVPKEKVMWIYSVFPLPHYWIRQLSKNAEWISIFGCRLRGNTIAELHRDHSGVKAKGVTPGTLGVPIVFYRAHQCQVNNAGFPYEKAHWINDPAPSGQLMLNKGLLHWVLQTQMTCFKVPLWSTEHLEGHHTRDHIHPIHTLYLHWCCDISVWIGCRK